MRQEADSRDEVMQKQQNENAWFVVFKEDEDGREMVTEEED